MAEVLTKEIRNKNKKEDNTPVYLEKENAVREEYV